MRITIVCGHFIPAMGYIEVHLARAFAELGHEVNVVTSTAIPPYVRHLHKDYGEAPKGVRVIRLKPFFSLGQVVRAAGVREAVRSTQPDRIMVIGLGKAFPKSALGMEIHTTALFGDNSASYGVSSSAKTRLLFETFKKSTYIKAIEKADRLVAYTPESFEAAGKMLGGKWAKKLDEQKDFISLGYHPNEFFKDERLRVRMRQELGFTEGDQVIITATRLTEEKGMERIIPAMQSSRAEVKWLILGSAEDEYAHDFETLLRGELGRNRYTLLPMQPREELNAYYNAADLALFPVPAISVIEALGSGLNVLFPKVKSLSHLPSIGSFEESITTSFDEIFASSDNLSQVEDNDEIRQKLTWQHQANLLLNI